MDAEEGKERQHRLPTIVKRAVHSDVRALRCYVQAEIAEHPLEFRLRGRSSMEVHFHLDVLPVAGLHVNGAHVSG